MMSTQKSSLVPVFVLLAATLALAPGAEHKTAAAPGQSPRGAQILAASRRSALLTVWSRTDEKLGSQAGVEILKHGGNAWTLPLPWRSHWPSSNPRQATSAGGRLSC